MDKEHLIIPIITVNDLNIPYTSFSHKISLPNWKVTKKPQNLEYHI